MRAIRFVLPLLGLLAAPAWAGEDTAAYALGVDGLSCPFCAYGIEKELASVDGVERIDVDIEAGLITVRMAAGATLDEGRARKATEDAGFSLRSFAPVTPRQ